MRARSGSSRDDSEHAMRQLHCFVWLMNASRSVLALVHERFRIRLPTVGRFLPCVRSVSVPTAAAFIRLSRGAREVPHVRSAVLIIHPYNQRVGLITKRLVVAQYSADRCNGMCCGE